MSLNIDEFINEYVSYLTKMFSAKQFDDITEISLPFFDRYNDSISVYMEQTNTDEFRISDDSYIMNTLQDSGLNMTDKRYETIEKICRRLGVSLNGSEMFVYSKKKDLVSKTHSLVQAMLRVDDMYLTTQSRVSTYFMEDVIEFFDKNEVYYSSDVSFIGKSGLTHNYDFLLQRNKERPERMCKAINNLNKLNFTQTMFAWGDILSHREQTELIIIANDRNSVSQEVVDGFSNYGVKTVMWSERNEKLELFQ